MPQKEVIPEQNEMAWIRKRDEIKVIGLRQRHWRTCPILQCGLGPVGLTWERLWPKITVA